ncbi:hypothetical protein J45TS6_24430 [Paenibacillus sp. J45TS6]|uniref:hypothetical protein n=1 Tax=unclassified Paenibacillus TaxID=185978 RepID=UPI001B23B39E|nr:hypothetical protein [Paenibacillus sp. J45TS6]GIP43984.1 hypothetical protein J45TS6_24430 [Paenibacillus sp. J45TS6]
MSRSVLYYLWVAIIGYLSGPTLYTAVLRFFYQEPLSQQELSALLTWSIPTFFTVGILLYLLSIILLRSLRIYNLLTQTVLFILVGILPAALFTLGAGMFSYAEISSLISPEGLLFLLFFSGIGVVCSYGVWARHKNLSKSPFYALSGLIIIAFVVLIVVPLG